MTWFELTPRYINLDHVDVFYWDEGNLYIFYSGDAEGTRYKDTDRHRYIRLCEFLGVEPVPETKEG